MSGSDLAMQAGASVSPSDEDGTLCHRRPLQPACGKIFVPSMRTFAVSSRHEPVALLTKTRSARLLGLLLACLITSPACSLADWRLVWNDEFNGVAVDASRWTYDLGTGPP